MKDAHLEATGCSDSHEVLRLSCNTSFHYRAYNSLSLVPILGHINPFRILSSCLFKKFINAVLPCRHC